ncbi:hypothetical protein [Mucilaginibacter sp. UYCu711]|uniref:hypothetical protein n=1 Tax=Mucilaginibacter sp. UYCu711 TaxID=3156339 RepID=UPI003D1FB06F
METQVIPTRAGQVCKTIIRLDDERTDDVYIVTEDPTVINDADAIEIVKLKDLQRNIKDASKAEKRKVSKSNLTVVGEDLQQYIASWNN